MYYVTSSGAAPPPAFRYDRMRIIPLFGLDPSGFRCKTSIVDKPPSWSDTDENLGSISESDEENDTLNDKNS